MEIWYSEKQTENLSISFKIKETLVRKKTKFQDLAIVDTLEYGKMLVLDGCVMTTEKDEFVYHEMLTHIPLFTHPKPENVLVIGGGDGGVVREVIKHKEVKKAVLVEIDGEVINECIKHLPSISSALNDKKVKVLVEDGIKFVSEHKKEFDVILVDSTDPVGPAEGLFSPDFYKNIFKALKDDGIFVSQTESPFIHDKVIPKVYRDISKLFPNTNIYTASIPTYPSGYWCFTIGSKKYIPSKPAKGKKLDFDLKYYNFDLHKAAFALPNFVKKFTLGK